MFKKIKDLKKQIIFVLILSIFLIFNILISFVSLRLDLSNGHAYTLSSATKKILRNLNNIVSINFFVSSDLPTRLIPLKTDVTDFLNEYKKAGQGKIVVKVLDPKKDEQALNQVKETGIPELQFSQLEQDKYAVTATYFGIAINYGDKKEIIAQATDVESLEYNLTAIIYKLVKKELPKIGFLGKENVGDPREDDLYSLKKVLAQQFNLGQIDLSSTALGYKSILVFDDNNKEYSQQEIDALKKYLETKGTAIFFVDGTWVLDNLQTDQAKHNLFNLIKDWGVEINKDLILSSSAELVNFGNETVQFFTPYPFWVKTNNFNSKTGYFPNVNQLTFPWTSSLTLQKKSGFETIDLIKTTDKSWEQKDGFVLNPQNIPQPQAKDLKEYIIAAQSKKKNGGMVIVIPSSRFVQEKYLTRTSENLGLILNIVNDLASEGALSGIRSRTVNFYPLPAMSENQKDVFKYLNILFLPGLFAIFGAIRLVKRK